MLHNESERRGACWSSAGFVTQQTENRKKASDTAASAADKQNTPLRACCKWQASAAAGGSIARMGTSRLTDRAITFPYSACLFFESEPVFLFARREQTTAEERLLPLSPPLIRNPEEEQFECWRERATVYRRRTKRRWSRAPPGGQQTARSMSKEKSTRKRHQHPQFDLTVFPISSIKSYPIHSLFVSWWNILIRI